MPERIHHRQFARALLLTLLSAGARAGGEPSQQAGATSQAPASAQQAEIVQLASEAGDALRQADYSRAIVGFEKLVKLQPGIAEFHANLGMAYYSERRLHDAARECREALRLKPRLTHARYFLAMSLAESGFCIEALPYIEADHLHVSDPQLKRVLETDALRCAMALGQPDKAVDFVRSLNRSFPDDPDALYLTSHVYSELSTRASERLLEAAPGSYQSHQLNAEVLEIQGKLSEAADEYRKVLSLNPRLQGIHYQLGRLALADSRQPAASEKARREFEEELKVDPSNAEAEYELGEMAQQAAQWEEAAKYFRRAADLDASFTEALVGLGKSLVSAGRAKEAIAPLEAAVALAPDNPVAHYQLFLADQRAGRTQEAEKELALYRQANSKARRTMDNIRTGMLGRPIDPQTAEPPP